MPKHKEKTRVSRREPRARLLARTDEIFRRLSEQNPAPRTELDSVNGFTMLIAIVLSAQSTDAGVNRATPALFARADTPQKMAALDPETVQGMIKTVNFSATKSRNVVGLAKKLVEEFGGEVPHDADALQTLPGVGRKTAHVWLNNVLGLPLIAVDTHVFRVANRLELCRTTSADETAEALEKLVPGRWKVHAHHWLILHGRYTCKARKPECFRCVIRDSCPYEPKTLEA